jgi:hypothetical protein
MPLASGYVQRSMARWPKEGERAPWRMHQNYVLDWLMLKWGGVTDPGLLFEPRRAATTSASASASASGGRPRRSVAKKAE